MVSNRLPAMLSDSDKVSASYHRCRFSDGFIDTFYDRFLAKSPEVQEKFRNTDFDQQKRMLRSSLLMVVWFNLRQPEAVAHLDILAEQHSRRGLDIPVHLYELWLDALVESVETNDAEYTPELGQLWRDAMRPGIDLFISKY